MGGGAFIQYRNISNLIAGAATLTIPQILGGINIQADTGTQTLTLPATASIITALGSVVGATCTFVYQNTAAQTVTVTAASGTTTIVGTATVNNTFASFLVVVASATTVTVYRTA
jgi:hypothetical protein